MGIIKKEPFQSLFFMEQHIDKLIKKSYQERNHNWTPVVDIIENNNVIILYVELAGVNETDMEVNINDNILLISGVKQSIEEIYNGDDYYYKTESFSGKFSRSFAIPDNIDTSNIKASFKDGILKIILQKTNNNRKIINIKVK